MARLTPKQIIKLRLKIEKNIQKREVKEEKDRHKRGMKKVYICPACRGEFEATEVKFRPEEDSSSPNWSAANIPPIDCPRCNFPIDCADLYSEEREIQPTNSTDSELGVYRRIFPWFRGLYGIADASRDSRKKSAILGRARKAWRKLTGCQNSLGSRSGWKESLLKAGASKPDIARLKQDNQVEILIVWAMVIQRNKPKLASHMTSRDRDTIVKWLGKQLEQVESQGDPVAAEIIRQSIDKVHSYWQRAMDIRSK